MNKLRKFTVLCFSSILFLTPHAFGSADGNAEVNCNLHGNHYNEIAEAESISSFVVGEHISDNFEEDVQSKAIDGDDG